MSNSNPIEQKPGARPHRRLALTRPSETPVSSPATDPEVPAPEVETTPDISPTVRVMAYLSSDEARVLDETWLKLRSHPSRPSKSDILRAACALASQDFDTLAKILSEQQNSTLSRQRSSKLRKSDL